MLRRDFSPEWTVVGAFCGHRSFLLLPKSAARLRWVGSPDGLAVAESLVAFSRNLPTLKQTTVRSGHSVRLTPRLTL
jgi:hypothetical protein